ncbi:hypothetical protein E2562_003726 [Oryza meyeriana var. granulata]|uniref:Uncharacterized protein n=1 Tax=Oryza meyeriana var. granulata TaxID=110450 RepID=A0A6G1C3U9_9ORYZ|nr:hypothetical protein E2562_003726 [Oryza meyeriana var. granulata]
MNLSVVVVDGDVATTCGGQWVAAWPGMVTAGKDTMVRELLYLVSSATTRPHSLHSPRAFALCTKDILVFSRRPSRRTEEM